MAHPNVGTRNGTLTLPYYEYTPDLLARTCFAASDTQKNELVFIRTHSVKTQNYAIS